MRIESFEIRNFRNLRFAACENVPNFLVICGANGCGKSALLEAIMTAKEHAGAYGKFPFDSRAVSAGASKAEIDLRLIYTETEKDFVRRRFDQDCPDYDDIRIEVTPEGSGRAVKRSSAAIYLLRHYENSRNSPGFFDFIDAHRRMKKSSMTTWNPANLSDEATKGTLARADDKFQMTKAHLASLKMRDLRQLQTSIREGSPSTVDSLEKIRVFFDDFFAPMKFKDVYIDGTPFRFVIETPNGEIDIDDLSSGEKEILNVFLRFHQLKPSDSVILFDEADAHLHPDLERKYLRVLRKLGEGNQLFVTTHSPEMMMEAGPDSLYTVRKRPPASGQSQFVQVTDDAGVYATLSELMGTRGIISMNQRVVFIEGEHASADREIFEAYYPPATHNVSFVPAGDSATVRGVAEKVNHLLGTSTGFQEYFSLVDGDIKRPEFDGQKPERLFRLPVYHIENYLVDEELLFKVVDTMLGTKCPYASAKQVLEVLRRLVLEDGHVNPYARALLDARIAVAAKKAFDHVYKKRSASPEAIPVPNYEEIRAEVRGLFEKALEDGAWKEKCKGRALLKALCGELKVKYEHVRNVAISMLEEPPSSLQKIMKKILGDGAGEPQSSSSD